MQISVTLDLSEEQLEWLRRRCAELGFEQFKRALADQPAAQEQAPTEAFRCSGGPMHGFEFAILSRAKAVPMEARLPEGVWFAGQIGGRPVQHCYYRNEDEVQYRQVVYAYVAAMPASEGPKWEQGADRCDT